MVVGSMYCTTKLLPLSCVVPTTPATVITSPLFNAVTAESVTRQGLVSETAVMVSADPVVVPILTVEPWAEMAVLGIEFS